MKIPTLAGGLFLGLAALFALANPLRAELVVGTAAAPPPSIALPSPPPPTAFFAAAATGDVEALRRLLAEGVPPDAFVPRPPPPELVALFNPRTRAGRLLTDDGATALMLAVATGKLETAALLIGAKANREAQTLSGLRPLDIAAEHNDIPAMQLLLGVDAASAAAHLSILVDLTAQCATLSRDGETVISTKISTGKKEKPTPPGTYVVTQKYLTWRSTLYHNAPMNFFLRLSCSPVGLHQGVVPNHPASHGCVRLPAAMAKKFYEAVPRGTLVVIR